MKDTGWFGDLVFKKELWSSLLMTICRLRPAPIWLNELISGEAWDYLDTYIRNQSTQDAEILKGKLIEHNKAGTEDKDGIEDLFNESQIDETLFTDAKNQAVCYKALYFACSKALEHCKKIVDKKKQHDTRFMREYFQKFEKSIESMPKPFIDNTRVAILSFWLMESPWYRIVNTVNYHCPDNFCTEDCWSKKEVKPRKTLRQKLCDESHDELFHDVYEYWFGKEMNLSSESRYSLKTNAKCAFLDCLKWLRSSEIQEIPVILYKNLPGLDTEGAAGELDNQPGLFYAALYSFRLCKNVGLKQLRGSKTQ